MRRCAEESALRLLGVVCNSEPTNRVAARKAEASPSPRIAVPVTDRGRLRSRGGRGDGENTSREFTSRRKVK